MTRSFDCEIKATDETIRRGIAGFKAQIVERREDKVIVRVWDDFNSGWSDPQRVKPEDVQEL